MSERRFAVDVSLVNLTEAERDLVNVIVALLTDPVLSMARDQFLAGDSILRIEDGDPTFSDAVEAVEVGA